MLLSVTEIPGKCERCGKHDPQYIVTFGDEMGPECDESECVCAECASYYREEDVHNRCSHPDGWVLDQNTSGMKPGTVVVLPLRCPHCGKEKPCKTNSLTTI